MTDFGRVGHIVAGKTDCTFMVIGLAPEGSPIRDRESDYRIAVVIEGVGYIAGPIYPGGQGAISLDDKSIEWLDD